MQNIILSIFFLFQKIYYITNITLKNQKCVINIVKAPPMAEAATMFTITPVVHLRDLVVIGGLHT
jgi:hypothetical protein